MEIEKEAIAGTLESSDAQVTVLPQTSGLDLTIESSVMNQYGRQIRETVLETLKNLQVVSGKVIVVDKGALECTLKARVECAVFRSNAQSEENVPWGGMTK
jgi:citrate lyase subunit gamma (acyl carrier protein)